MENIRIIIADSQLAFRQGLTALLSSTPGLQIVAQTGKAEEALALCAEHKPEVALVDSSIRGLCGHEAARAICEVSPDTAVIVLGRLDSPRDTLSALRAGAAGYLSKHTPYEEMIMVIRMAAHGHGILDRGMAEKIIGNFGNDNSNGQLKLNPREVEVLKLTARGMRNKEIALKLAISERTVQTHLSNIFNKLEVDSRSEAVLQALKEGLLDIKDLS